MKLALRHVNEIDTIKFPEEIMLYEQAGFIEKSNMLKIEYISDIFTKSGFKVLKMALWVDNGNKISACNYGRYNNWNISPVKKYMGAVPAKILRSMANIVNKAMLFIIYPQTSDPVLIYELPYTGSNKFKVCVVLTDWE